LAGVKRHILEARSSRAMMAVKQSDTARVLGRRGLGYSARLGSVVQADKTFQYWGRWKHDWHTHRQGDPSIANDLPTESLGPVHPSEFKDVDGVPVMSRGSRVAAGTQGKLAPGSSPGVRVGVHFGDDPTPRWYMGDDLKKLDVDHAAKTVTAKQDIVGDEKHYHLGDMPNSHPLYGKSTELRVPWTVYKGARYIYNRGFAPGGRGRERQNNHSLSDLGANGLNDVTGKYDGTSPHLGAVDPRALTARAHINPTLSTVGGSAEKPEVSIESPVELHIPGEHAEKFSPVETPTTWAAERRTRILSQTAFNHAAILRAPAAHGPSIVDRVRKAAPNTLAFLKNSGLHYHHELLLSALEGRPAKSAVSTSIKRASRPSIAAALQASLDKDVRTGYAGAEKVTRTTRLDKVNALAASNSRVGRLVAKLGLGKRTEPTDAEVSRTMKRDYGFVTPREFLRARRAAMENLVEFEDGGMATLGGPLHSIGEPNAKPADFRKTARYRKQVSWYASLVGAPETSSEMLATEFLRGSLVAKELSEEFPFSSEHIHRVMVDEVHSHLERVGD